MASPEIWHLIPSVPGLLASSRGRLMVFPSIAPLPNGGLRHYSGRARTGCWDGSRYIFSWKGKNYKVARLVCEAFNGAPPANKSVCMHLDENSKNNYPSNLQWGTQRENLNAVGFIRYCRARIGDKSPRVKGRKRVAA